MHNERFTPLPKEYKEDEKGLFRELPTGELARPFPVEGEIFDAREVLEKRLENQIRVANPGQYIKENKPYVEPRITAPKTFAANEKKPRGYSEAFWAAQQKMAKKQA